MTTTPKGAPRVFLLQQINSWREDWMAAVQLKCRAHVEHSKKSDPPSVKAVNVIRLIHKFRQKSRIQPQGHRRVTWPPAELIAALSGITS